MLVNTNPYFTSSLSLAAALQTASSAKIEKIEFLDSRHATFLFDKNKDKKFDQLLSLFWAKQLPIDALSYFESLKSLKNRLHEEQYSFSGVAQ